MKNKEATPTDRPSENFLKLRKIWPLLVAFLLCVSFLSKFFEVFFCFMISLHF